MNYAIKILLEQKELLTDEMEFVEGEERIEIKRRLIDTANALNKLNLPHVSNQREQLKHYSNFLHEKGYLTKDFVLMEYEQSML